MHVSEHQQAERQAVMSPVAQEHTFSTLLSTAVVDGTRESSGIAHYTILLEDLPPDRMSTPRAWWPSYER